MYAFEIHARIEYCLNYFGTHRFADFTRESDRLAYARYKSVPFFVDQDYSWQMAARNCALRQNRSQYRGAPPQDANLFSASSCLTSADEAVADQVILLSLMYFEKIVRLFKTSAAL